MVEGGNDQSSHRQQVEEPGVGPELFHRPLDAVVENRPHRPADRPHAEAHDTPPQNGQGVAFGLVQLLPDQGLSFFQIHFGFPPLFVFPPGKKAS